MTLNTVLPFCSSAVSFIFASLVFDQWLRRRRTFQLVWTVGLLWYGISAGTEFLGSAFGWNATLYRLWYLIGALYVAAYLGAGTVYLLRRTRFGYFVSAALVLGGLISLAAIAKYPGSQFNGTAAFILSLVAAVAIAAVTTWRRDWNAHVAMGFLVMGSLIVAYLVVTAHLRDPGYATDPTTHVPVGAAIPNYLRVLTVPFNVTGAFALVFGAIYSAYVYMPKRRLMRAHVRIPVVAQAYGALAVAVNLVVSLPRAIAALFEGRLNSRVPATILIALGGFIPGVTSSLNRFGVTWSFFLGEFLGVVLIFAGFLISEEVFATSWIRNRKSEALT